MHLPSLPKIYKTGAFPPPNLLKPPDYRSLPICPHIPPNPNPTPYIGLLTSSSPQYLPISMVTTTTTTEIVVRPLLAALSPRRPPPLTTTTTTTPQPPAFLQPPPPLIRKKLGDIVKLLLKLLLLARLALTPQLPGRKLVKFADRLTNVRMFDGLQLPQMVLTPLQLPQLEFDVEYIAQGAGDYFGLPSAAPRLALFDFQLDSDLDEDGSGKYDIDFTTMARPHQYFYQQLGGAGAAGRAPGPVYMHLVQINGDNHFVGLVDVANIAFEKFLEIKLTVDGWRSLLSIPLTLPLVTYVKPLGDGLRDQFKFSIPLDGLTKGQPEVTVELCCKYAAGGQVFWDNNHHQNYKVVLRRQGAKRQLAPRKVVPAADDEPAVPVAPRRKLEFSKYNFDVQRPPLKPLHSLPDIFGTAKPRYSRQYRDKHSAEVPRLDAFAKLSYTDLLAQFCFSGGSLAAAAPAPKESVSATTLAKAATTTTSSTIDHPTLPRKLTACRPLTAATLHSLGDEIHI